MPKNTALDATGVEKDGSIIIQLGLQIVEGEELIFTQPLRRIVPPDGDVEQNLDDLDVWLVDNGYPILTEEQRGVILALDAAAHASPEIERNRQKWIEQQQAQQAAMQLDAGEPDA